MFCVVDEMLHGNLGLWLGDNQCIWEEARLDENAAHTLRNMRPCPFARERPYNRLDHLRITPPFSQRSAVTAREWYESERSRELEEGTRFFFDDSYRSNLLADTWLFNLTVRRSPAISLCVARGPHVLGPDLCGFRLQSCLFGPFPLPSNTCICCDVDVRFWYW